MGRVGGRKMRGGKKTRKNMFMRNSYFVFQINPLLLRPQNIGVRPAGLMVLIVLIIEE